MSDIPVVTNMIPICNLPEKTIASKQRAREKNPFSQYLSTATCEEMGLEFAIGEPEYNEMLAMASIFANEQPGRLAPVHVMELVNMHCNVNSKQFTFFLSKLPRETTPSVKQGLIDAFFASNGMSPPDFFDKYPGFVPRQNSKYAVYGFTQVALKMLNGPWNQSTVLTLIHNSKNVLLPIKII